jgi:hypothetical protein
MNKKRNLIPKNTQANRTRMKELGFRQISLWVPDTRAPKFRKECRRQSRLAAAADRSEEIDELSDAVAGSVEGWT